MVMIMIMILERIKMIIKMIEMTIMKLKILAFLLLTMRMIMTVRIATAV